MNIYKDVILDHYKNPRHYGRLSRSTHSVKGSNPFCGDKITFDILIKDNLIKDIKFSGSGCAISIASASMLSDYLYGKSKDSLKKLDKNFIIKTLGVDLGPTRLKCALLPLETAQKII